MKESKITNKMWTVGLPKMNGSIRFLFYQIIVTKSWQIHVWKPSWSIEILLDIIRPATTFVSLVMKKRKIKQLVLDDIEESWLIHQTIHYFLFLFLLLKCSKQSVPDGEPASIILVQTISVCSMVNSRIGKILHHFFNFFIFIANFSLTN